MNQRLALVHGPSEPTLWHKTLGSLLEEQAARFGDRPAVVFPWQSASLSYSQLADRSKVLAKAMLDMGLRHGECVGVMAGNCHQYIEVFLAGGRIGCPVVVLNNTYTPQELRNAVRNSCEIHILNHLYSIRGLPSHKACRLVFIAARIGSRSLSNHIKILRGMQCPNEYLPELDRVVCIGESTFESVGVAIQSYSVFMSNGHSVFMNDARLKRAENATRPTDVLNLQFTSGTTGSPKASMLTHTGLINNGRFVGRALRLTPDDIVCCPPPLFHCFGLVLGFLASLCHGSTIIFPSDHFDVGKVVDAVLNEDVTVLLGVPTMHVSVMEIVKSTGRRPRRLRTGLASGSPVSQRLMIQLREILGVEKMLITYGMTETSPVTFIASLDDPDEKRTTTIGRVFPHTTAKVVDKRGNTLLRGQRGELYISGFVLQKGYWRNEEKTNEVMQRDEEGTLWMHTGDEAILDADGYAKITGRIKDIIIRGGENIFPGEIEERLAAHPSISEASVIGIQDERYGEVVGCFVKAAVGHSKVTDTEIRQWAGGKLGRHKAPQYVFWIGDPGVGDSFPMTGSGKHQKGAMRDIAHRLIAERSSMVSARL